MNRYVVLIILFSLLLRLGLTLSHDGYLGVDGGAYLLSRNAVLGDEPTGADFTRPPLAPGWLLVPFTSLLGDDHGYKVWSSLASVLPLIAGYILARRLLPERQAVFVVGFLSLDLLLMEMLVTGALPLIGFSLIALALWAIASLIDRFTWQAVATLVLSLPLIALVNNTSAGLAAIILPVYTGAAVWFFRHRCPDHLKGLVTGAILFRIAPWLTLGGLLALSALPWYIEVLPGSDIYRYQGPWFYLAPMWDSAWLQALLCVPVGYWVARYGRYYQLQALGVATMVLGVLTLGFSTDESLMNLFYRSRYLVAIPFYICTSWLVWKYVIPRVSLRLAAPATAIVAILLFAGSLRQFEAQAAYSDMVRPAAASALAQAKHEAPDQGILTNAFSMSLWVSALNKVPSPHPWTLKPPKAFTEEDQHVRCVLGWVAGCDVGHSFQALGVGYVLVDTRFPNYNERAPDIWMAPEDPWTVTSRSSWLELVYAEDTVYLWKVKEARYAW